MRVDVPLETKLEDILLILMCNLRYLYTCSGYALRLRKSPLPPPVIELGLCICNKFCAVIIRVLNDLLLINKKKIIFLTMFRMIMD